jgi:hypothetical protein
VAVGIFFGTFDASGRWFHLARVDSLSLLSILAPAYVLRFRRTPGSAVLAGVLMALAFLTKQSSILALGCLLASALLVDRVRALVAAAAGALVAGLAVGVLLATSDGWFGYYAFEVARKHGVDSSMLLGFWTWDMARMGVALALAALGLAATTTRCVRAGLLDCGLFAGTLGLSWAGRLHPGAYDNVLMPVHASLALFMAIGAAAVAGQLGRRERELLGGSPSAVAVGLLVVFQAAALDYRRTDALPAPDARARGEAFLAELRGLEGEILLPDYRWVPRRIGLPTFGLEMAALDVLRVEDQYDVGAQLLRDSFDDALRSRRFSAIVLSDPMFVPGIRRQYRFERPIETAPLPVTGDPRRPLQLWVPRT